MKYEDLKYLKDHNISLKLLRSENAPFIISFLHRQFKNNNQQVVTADKLEENLFDYIYTLRQEYGDDVYPDTAGNYLDRWANDSYLRKFYLSAKDIANYELTPYTEKVFEWINELDKKEFIGTESRLFRIFDLLHEIAFKTNTDPEKRLKELNKQKQEIEHEIERIKAGTIDVLDSTQVKERYYELHDCSRKLLSDFKEIEYNFRELDRKAREDQVSKNLKKGKLLEEVFAIEDYIWDTDQGKSFKAFWEFLMSNRKQIEFNSLIDTIKTLPETSIIKNDTFLEKLKLNLVDAGSKVNKTTHLLIEHLGKFLNDTVFFENKRIMEIIKDIKKSAVEAKQHLTKERRFTEIDLNPYINHLMSRPLFTPPRNPRIRNIEVSDGEADFASDAIFNQFYIDKEELRRTINRMLKGKTQISLKEIIESCSTRIGISEIIAYMEIAANNNKAFINDQKSEHITIENRHSEKTFTVKVPEVLFIR